MSILGLLIPAALLLGGIGLLAFLWCLRSNQFEDLEGAAHRILFDEDDDQGGPGHARPPGPEMAHAQPHPRGSDEPQPARGARPQRVFDAHEGNR